MKRLILIFALILVLLGFSIYDVGGISEYLSSYELEDYPGTYIGFTDFECEVKEGSKSEIFRRCDAGASNENDLVPEKYNLSVDSKLVGNLRANTYATRGNTYTNS